MSGATAPALFRAVGLMPDGPAVLGRPVRAAGPGVYVVELATPLRAAPIELTRVGKWLERVPTLSLDGDQPTSKQLAARLAAFWLPSAGVLFIGSTSGSVAGRLMALDRHVLGDSRPHAAAQWLKTLRVDGLRVWWASTDAPEEYEDALLEAFAAAVPGAERAALPDTDVILPFANLRTPTGGRKRHGIAGSTLPEVAVPPSPPSRLVEVAPGDAEGARVEAKASGTTRRTNRPASAGTPRPRPTPLPAKPAVQPVELTADGLARLRAELEELIRGRRPEVIARVKAARELGDLRENSEYTAARAEQSFLEGRIQALEARLRHAVIAEAPVAGARRVTLGSRVTVAVDGEEQILAIVGSAESDPTAGRISAASPVGRALLGAEGNSDVVVRTPAGERHYRILAID